MNEDGTVLVECPRCEGTKWVTRRPGIDPQEDVDVVCGFCDGEGEVSDEKVYCDDNDYEADRDFEEQLGNASDSYPFYED
jgi:DnaJ-class molecular chaperone